MPKVSDAHRAAQRERILDAALRCFQRAGYQRTSMADIIAESGLSAGAIYLYFPGKQELVRAVAARVLDARSAELSAEGADHPLAPAEILATVLRGIGSEGLDGILLQLWAEATVDSEVARIVQDVFARLLPTIADALTAWARANPSSVAGSPDAWAARVAPVLMSVGPGFILQRALVPGFDSERYIASLELVLPSA